MNIYIYIYIYIYGFLKIYFKISHVFFYIIYNMGFKDKTYILIY